ncbi:hypothetical protein ACLX1H_007586 [Fusarium chlamydosporum]
MAIVFEDQFDQLENLMAGETSQLSKARAEVLEPAYDSYLESGDVRERASPPPILQLISSVDITVELSRCHKTGAATDLNISRTSDPIADNFMGYCPEQKCVAFKGEGGLFYDFVDFVESAADKLEISGATIVLKAPSQIRMPFDGLEYGLKYEEFVSRVEVLQCAVWIRTSPSEQEEGGRKFVQIATDSRTPPPSTPKYIPVSPDAIRAHGTEPEHHDSPTRSLSDSDSPLTSCGSSLPPPTPLDETASQSDSSTLSSPPTVIHTPPWLRDLNE